ncbi:MMPL family transporter [Aeromicrobium massiliense]|uniref:MMPL family transporter n=1 Tax=Aeromicrobium massiliense TaxID=1464554 RepID=UPI0003077B71|nr:MMPL family transporter [Aeromicrobium massiliense]
MSRSTSGWITHRWTKWAVLVVALVLTGIFGSLGSRLTEVEDNDVGSWLPGSAESTQVIEQSSAFSDPDAVPAVLLYTRPGGLTPQDLAAVAEDAKEVADVDTVSAPVVGPIPSEDGEAAQLVVTLTVGQDGWDALPDLVDDLRDVAEDGAPDGLTVHLAGPAALGADQADAFAGIDGILLLAAVGVVVIMLLLTYRSPVLWLIPLFCGVVSLGIAQGVVYLLADAGLTVNAQSAGILTVLVFGAGTDYALLLIARYREELHHFEDRHEAMAHALRHAGPAIIASGATVVVGLLCLLFAEMNSTSSLGPVTAAGIVVALVVMLTLLPALLVIFGRWVFWPLVPHHGDPDRGERTMWGRIGRRIDRRPRTVWITTSLVLAACAIGIVQLNATGLSNADTFTSDQPSIAAGEVLAEHFPGGAGNPVQVVADADAADDVAAALGDVDGIAPGTVTEPVVRDGLAYVEATLADPADSDAAADTIDRARETLHTVDGADALVGGATAVNLDVQRASSNDNALIIPIVLVAVLIILGVLLRSIAAPLILLGTVVLSFGAALGLSALIFRHLLGFAGADTSFPLFAFVFLVALGIDYNIFLMTRVREEALRHGTRRGALLGLAATGGVITSAGLVLAGTFAALATLPIVFLAELGLVVALGVLLDTIIVRSVLVTALNLDLGRHIWWPSRLWRTDGPAKTPPEQSREAVRT